MCDVGHCANVGTKNLPNGKRVCQKHYDEQMWFRSTLQAEASKDTEGIDVDCDRCGKEMEFTPMVDINGKHTHLVCVCGNKRKIR